MKDSKLIYIVDKCKKGDKKAYKELYDILSPKMFALCIRYMGDKCLAENVLQDGFVTLFSKIEMYTGIGAFEGWARKIFVNTALMNIRKNDVLKNTEELDVAVNLDSSIPNQLQDLGYQELLNIIALLPTGYRTIFNMYVVEGYSHKEIAEELNISEATSRSQLLRARGLIQNKIKELYNGK